MACHFNILWQVKKLWPAISVFELPKMELTITIKEISVFPIRFYYFCHWLTYLVRTVNSGVNSVKKSNLLNSNRCKQRLIRVDRLIFLAVAAIAT